MLGVVAEHAATEYQPLPKRATIEAGRTATGEPLAWQPERVADGSPKQQSGDPIHIQGEARPMPVDVPNFVASR